MAKKKTKPRASTLAKFKGTRKQLAKKYGVSERTIYRWLNKAKEKGTEIESRQQRSRYPGPAILDEQGTNKELADKYGVSTRTISRWRSRALMESGPWEVPEYNPEEKDAKQWGLPDDEPLWEVPEPEEEQPWEVPEPEEPPEFDDYTGQKDFSQDTLDDLKALTNLVLDNDLLVGSGSLWFTLNYNEKIEILNEYVEKRVTEDPELFYNEETGEIDLTPEFVSTVNIWGSQFEKFLIEKLESNNYVEHD